MLTGNKVDLRLFHDENEVLKYAEIFNNLEGRAATDHTEIYSPVRQIKKFNDTGLWSNDQGTLLITTKEDIIIGSIGFSRKTEFELAIGYRIIENEHRNKGYMTEGLNLFTQYLFSTIPLITRLSLYTAEDNTSSRRLAEKCGFKQEGILRDAYFYRGKMCNWVIYSLLRCEVLDNL